MGRARPEAALQRPEAERPASVRAAGQEQPWLQVGERQGRYWGHFTPHPRAGRWRGPGGPLGREVPGPCGQRLDWAPRDTGTSQST